MILCRRPWQVRLIRSSRVKIFSIRRRVCQQHRTPSWSLCRGRTDTGTDFQEALKVIQQGVLKLPFEFPGGFLVHQPPKLPERLAAVLPIHKYGHDAQDFVAGMIQVIYIGSLKIDLFIQLLRQKRIELFFQLLTLHIIQKP